MCRRKPNKKRYQKKISDCFHKNFLRSRFIIKFSNEITTENLQKQKKYANIRKNYAQENFSHPSSAHFTRSEC